MADHAPIIITNGLVQQQPVGDSLKLRGNLDVNTYQVTAAGVLILEPGGTGAFQADSSGNARGDYAVDLQMDRQYAAEVAMGNYSVVIGGYGNKTYNIYSACLTGLSNHSYGSYSVVCGGHNNYISSVPTHAFVGGGQLNEVTANHSGVCCGYDNTVSGHSSVISGGYENSISANYGFIGGGQENIVAANFSLISGGYQNSISAGCSYATITGGWDNTITTSSRDAICGGWKNTITSAGYTFIGAGYECTINEPYSCIVGSQKSIVNEFHGGIYNSYEAEVCETSNYGTIIGGKYAKTEKYYGQASGGNVVSKNWGEVARASGCFSVDGDAQTSLLVARKTIAGATPTTLRLDGSSEQIALDDHRSYVFCAHVIGRAISHDKSAAYRIEGVITKGSGNAVLEVSTTTVIHEDDASWDAEIIVINPNLMYVFVTGAADHTIHWVARIEMTQVGGAVITENLVAAWFLNETSGNRADAIGSNDLVDVNTVGYVAGKVSNAAHFIENNEEKFTCAGHTDLTIGDNDWQLTCWVRSQDLDADQFYIGRWDYSNNRREYKVIYQNTADRFSFASSSDGTLQPVIAADTFGAPSLNTWYFISVRYDKTNDKIGISINNGAWDELSVPDGGIYVNTATDLEVAYSTGYNYADADIDSVHIWKGRLLEADELTFMYNSGSGREVS